MLETAQNGTYGVGPMLDGRYSIIAANTYNPWCAGDRLWFVPMPGA